MFSEPLAKIKNETKIKTSLRARGPPGVSGALCSVRILRIGRIGSEYIYSKWTYFPEGQQFTKNVFFIGLMKYSNLLR